MVLPAATGFEFDDLGHFGLAHGWISARPKIVDPPGEAWPDIRILSELGRALGHEEHFWEDYHGALDEVLAPSGLTYDRFKDQGLLKGTINYFNYQAKGFKTPSKKVELFSAQLSKWGFDPLPTFGDPLPPSLEYPLLATSRKSPYFFHSAYRQIDALRKKHPDPVVEIHPLAARILGLQEGEWAAIVTPQGRITQKVRIRILSELGRALGHEEHFWEDYHGALDEVLAPSGLTYDRFKDQGLLRGNINYFNYQAKGFKTPSKKVELFSAQLSQWGLDPLPTFGDPLPPSLEYPLLATSRKSPYFFHSAYRQLDSLRKKHPDPVVEIHPLAARILGLQEGEWAAIVTPQGRITQKVRLTEAIDPRVVYVDYGWWFPEAGPERLFDWDRSNINVLTANSPLSREMGTPYLRAFPCRVEKI